MTKSKIDWHIGCSGFSYREWKTLFYPPGMPSGKWFGYYKDHFNTLESNMTFYRLPLLSTLEKWYKESGDGFSFCVKAPRLITHYKQFQHVSEDLTKFYDLMLKGLKDKLACVLFQLPPSYTYTKERLTNIVEVLDPSFTNTIEFRHESWWNEDVYKTFKKNSISFCNISHPKFVDSIVATSPVFYFRFHGVPKLYYSVYDNEYLDSIIGKIKGLKNVKTVYLLFNNTAGPGAIDNARYIMSLP